MKRSLALLLLLAACSTSRHVQTLPTATVPSSAQPSAAATATMGTGPALLRVPVDFVPDSYTFVSPVRGWALGQGACPSRPVSCTWVLTTQDAAKTWRALSVIAAGQPHTMRFGSGYDGFAWSATSFLTTHNGGLGWKPQLAGGEVLAAETSGQLTWLVTRSCPTCAPELRRGKVHGDSWTPVKGVALQPGAVSAQLVLHGPAVYVLGAPQVPEAPALAYSSPDGRQFSPLDLPCQRGETPSLAVDASLLLSCSSQQGQASYWSAPAPGSQWQPLPAPFSGAPRGLTQSGTIDFAMSGAVVRLSQNGGRSWSDSLAGRTDLRALGFVTPTLGFVLEGQKQRHLLVTRDGGQSWSPVTFI